jgi:tricorn protease
VPACYGTCRCPTLRVSVWIGALATPPFGQNTSLLLLRNPSLSETQIAFEYADDLWIVSRTGGSAMRLTSGPGRRTGAHFWPDGTQIAFTGEYDGNIDVYGIPASGGVPSA